MKKDLKKKNPSRNPKGRDLKWTPEALEELGNELIDFSQNTEALTISKFEIHKGYRVGWLKQIAKTHPSFHDFIDKAEYVFGNKMLEATMSDCKPHGWVVANVMPKYLNEIQKSRLEVLDKEEAIKHKYKAKEASQADERADRIIDALERQVVKKKS